jgi:hypothetical protein
MADQTPIQFIPAEELMRLAELERKESQSRTVEGFMNDMEEVYQSLGGTNFMGEWAKANPGDFFKLKARMVAAQAKQGNQQESQKIIIGLPYNAALDGPNE